MNSAPEQGESAGLSFSRELTRKGLHLISATIPVGYAAGLSRRSLLLVLASGLAAAVVVEVARWRSAHARAVFDSGVGSLLRDHEAKAVSGATWLIIAAFFRISSLAALVSALFAPFFMLILYHVAHPYFVAVALISALLVWRHRDNIRNLLAGTESRLGRH